MHIWFLYFQNNILNLKTHVYSIMALYTLITVGWRQHLRQPIHSDYKPSRMLCLPLPTRQKCQNPIFKEKFLFQKSSKSFWVKNKSLGAHFCSDDWFFSNKEFKANWIFKNHAWFLMRCQSNQGHLWSGRMADFVRSFE